MDSKLNNIEEQFRKAAEKQSEIPSPSVLRKIRLGLMADDFFSLRPNKLNVVYTGIVATGIIAFMLFNEEQSEIKNSPLEAVVEEQPLEDAEKTSKAKEKESKN